MGDNTDDGEDLTWKSVIQVLKIVLGETSIELEVGPGRFSQTTSQVKVNGQIQQLDADGRVTIQGGIRLAETGQLPFASRQQNQKSNLQQEPSDEPLAVVECNGIRCALRSEPYKIYTSIDSSQVKVEVRSSRSECLVCYRSRYAIGDTYLCAILG